MVENLKATKTNFETASVDTSCAFGAETSLANLKKLVLLDAGVESKAITLSELQTTLKQQQKEDHSLGFTMVSYSGLGVPAVYYTSSVSGIYFQGISGIDGTHTFGAAVYSKALSQSKLAALAKLAAKI
jgi:hypothetical protein